VDSKSQTVQVDFGLNLLITPCYQCKLNNLNLQHFILFPLTDLTREAVGALNCLDGHDFANKTDRFVSNGKI
jgi:hypothetical protein